MKGKKLALILVLAMIVSMLVACSGNASQSSGPAGGSSGKAIPIRISSTIGESNPQLKTFQTFWKDTIEAKTKGAYTVETYPNGSLYDDVKAVEAIRNGTLESVVCASSVYLGLVPDVAIFDIPFLFSNEAVADLICDGEMGEMFKNQLPEKGIYLLGICENGFRNLSNSKKVVKTPADVKGMKIRTMENQMHLKTWTMLGANPTPMAWTEVFTAVQQDAIDGQENPIPNIYSTKIYEVTPYISLTGHIYSPSFWSFSKKIMDKYPQEIQTIILESVPETVAYERNMNREQNTECRTIMEEAGCTITDLTSAEKQQFRDAVTGMWDVAASNIGSELIEKLKAAVAAAEKTAG